MAQEQKKKNKGLNIPQTSGSFQLRGIVKGVDKDNFYKEGTTKNDGNYRRVNFGVDINKDQTVYVELFGSTKDAVYFSKAEGTGKDKTTEVEKVDWSKRFDFKKDGFKLIGVNVGITKTTDKNGKEVNDKKTLVEYDACKYIGENLQDDMSVYVRGKLEYSTYNDKHQTRYSIQQVSLCKDIDFENAEYKPVGNFEQVVVYMGIEKQEDHFVVSAKIVGYNSVEDTEFVVKNPKLANNLRKLKPYTSIKVFGDIEVKNDTEMIEEEDDGWGTPNPMERISNPTVRLLVINGAEKESINTDTYSEELIESALTKINNSKTADKDYGDNDDDGWGDAPLKSDDDNGEDDEW